MTNETTSTKDKNEAQENRESEDLLLGDNTPERNEMEALSLDRDLEDSEPFKTNESDGHTLNPYVAQEQGLVYTPPTDPPVLPGDDPQGAEVAAGFATSMEETNPDIERLPDEIDNNDLDLRDDIYIALHNNSETGHLTNVKVQVEDGVVNLVGTVTSEDDIGMVQSIVQELEGVLDVNNNLQVGGIY